MIQALLTLLSLTAALPQAWADDARPVPALQETGPTVTVVSPALEAPGGQAVSAWTLATADRAQLAASLAWTPTRRLRLHASGLTTSTPTWAASDLTLGGTLALLQAPRQGVDLALVPELTWVPRLGSVQSLEARLGVALGGRTPTLGWNLVATGVADTGQDVRAEAGAVLRARVFSQVWLIGEVRGGFGLVGQPAGLAPIETALALTTRTSPHATALVFTQVGIDPQTLAWEWRLGLGIRARRTGLPPDLDRDHVSNRKDDCTRTPEDVDGTEDLDGCPELDDDRDGLADRVDQCPTEAEDLDGHADDDGCPDPDNDQDGVLEPEDQCPNAPGRPALGGCPDGDGDHVVDGVDACPARKGTPEALGCPDWDTDGVPDPRDLCPRQAAGPDAVAAVSDGCPALLRLAGAQVSLGEPLAFAATDPALQDPDDPGLRALVKLLRSHPDVHLVLLNDGTSLGLARAGAVRQVLVADGHLAGHRVSIDGADTPGPLLAGDRAEVLLFRVEGP